MTDPDLAETAGWLLRRYRLAVHAALLVGLMLAAAAVVNALWSSALGNVIAGLLIVFAGALVLLMLVVGVSMSLQRFRNRAVE